MANIAPEAQLDAINAGSLGELQALGQSIKAAGVDVQRAYDALVSTAAALPAWGKMARQEMDGIRTNDALPAEHRARINGEQKAIALTVIGKAEEAMKAYTSLLEATLKAAVLPKPAADPAQRTLKRQVAQALVARARGDMPTLAASANDPGVAAELLDEFGTALLPAGDALKGFHALMLEKFMRPTTPGTARQLDAKLALRGFYAAKIPGRIPGFGVAARQALG